VHDAGLVCGRQRVCRLPQQWGGLVRRQRTIASDQLGEGRAGDVLHHQPAVVALRDEVVDGDDVGMVQPGGEPGLALGAVEVEVALARAEADPLEGDLATEDLVLAQPDRAHPTAPDLSVERVPACDHCLPTSDAGSA
jgi:hypothetical protein